MYINIKKKTEETQITSVLKKFSFSSRDGEIFNMEKIKQSVFSLQKCILAQNLHSETFCKKCKI